MMRLAGAGVIRRKNYSEKWHLDTWSATTEAGAEMMTLVKRMRDSPSQVNLDIRRLLNPSSPVEAGRNLYTRITKVIFKILAINSFISSFQQSVI